MVAIIRRLPAAPAGRRPCAIRRARSWWRPPLPARGIARLNVNFEISAIIALLAGILILIRPKLLNFIVAIYLIVIGILGLVR
jgi:hypothetical protein